MSVPSYRVSSPVDRRISARQLAALLGAWQHGNVAYTALADAIRLCLLNGSLPTGSRLPGERELAQELGLSRTTTAAAYRRLRDQGYLSSRQGSGSITTVPSRRDGEGATVRPAGDLPGMLDLTMAAPAAPPDLHLAYAQVLDDLPTLLTGRGYEAFGLPELREAVAADYTQRGAPTTPDEILITTGAQHGLHTLLTALVGPGDRVVVEHPTYANALAAIRNSGARAVPVAVGPDGLDLDQLEATVRQVSPRLVYLIPDFHNPTATSLDLEGRARVRALARRHGTVVVADETLTGVALDGEAPPPLAGTGRATGSLVSIGSASKTFWGGLRVGWVRAHPDLVTRLAGTRYAIDLGTALVEQRVTATLIAGGNRLSDQRRALLRSQRDHLVRLLAERLPSWSPGRSAGGLGTWVDLGAPVSTAFAALALGHGVRVTPGPAFGVDGSFETHLRIPYATSTDHLDQAVAALQSTWNALESRGPRSLTSPLLAV